MLAEMTMTTKQLSLHDLPPLSKAALFFDIDGTLAPIAARADLVLISTQTQQTLELLAAKTQGALALVSGRPLDQIDLLFHPHQYKVAAEYGAVIRLGPKKRVMADCLRQNMEVLFSSALLAVKSLPGVVVERKSFGIALHYRAAPEHRDAVWRQAQRLAACHPGLHVLAGKMVAEIKTTSSCKGKVLIMLHGLKPFKGRQAVFFGDDTGDEPAFQRAQASGGMGIKVGPEDSAAQFRINHQDELVPLLVQWLSR